MEEAEPARPARVVVVVVVTVALVIAAGVIVALGAVDRDGSPPGHERIPVGAAPSALAAEACGYLLGEFPGQITEDAPADEVLAGVARAEQLARAAADRDPRWISLAGGVGALRESLQEDDPGAASVAIRVVSQSCADAGVEPDS